MREVNYIDNFTKNGENYYTINETELSRLKNIVKRDTEMKEKIQQCLNDIEKGDILCNLQD